MKDIFDQLCNGIDLSKVDNNYKEKRDSDSPLNRKTVEDHLPSTIVVVDKIPKIVKIRAFLVSKSSVFIPFNDLFPECSFLNRENKKVPILACLAKPGICTHPADTCIQKLLNRMGKIASAREDWEMFLLYWRLYLHKNSTEDSRFGLVFWPKLKNFLFIPINNNALDLFLNRRSVKFEIELGIS